MIGAFLGLVIMCWLTTQVFASAEIDRLFKEGKYKKYKSGHATINEISLADLTAAWIVVEEKKPRLTAVKVSEDGPSRDILHKHVPKSAIVATNGGFFGFDNRGKHTGLGLLVSEGKILQPIHPWKFGGVLFQNPKLETSVVPIAFYRKEKPTVVTAIQSTPLVIEEGKIAIYSDRNDGKFNRSAVGILHNGLILIAGVFQTFGEALTLKDFAYLLAKLNAFDQTRVMIALALDGGPGAQIYVPSLDLYFGDSGHNFYANITYWSK